MAEITVERRGEDGSVLRFHVTVREGEGSTEHEVTLSSADLDRLGWRFDSPEGFVRASFEFLLDREPKESILPSFDIGVIGGYFPEFEATIRGA